MSSVAIMGAEGPERVGVLFCFVLVGWSLKDIFDRRRFGRTCRLKGMPGAGSPWARGGVGNYEECLVD